MYKLKVTSVRPGTGSVDRCDVPSPFVRALIGSGQGWSVSARTLYSGQYMVASFIVLELCESRGGRPGLSVLTSLLVSVDVKFY